MTKLLHSVKMSAGWSPMLDHIRKTTNGVGVFPKTVLSLTPLLRLRGSSPVDKHCAGASGKEHSAY